MSYTRQNTQGPPSGQAARSFCERSKLRQKLAWISEYDDSGEPWEDYIRSARCKAVFGCWPDGKPHPFPNRSRLSASQIKWLTAQHQPSAWENVARSREQINRERPEARETGRIIRLAEALVSAIRKNGGAL